MKIRKMSTFAKISILMAIIFIATTYLYLILVEDIPHETQHGANIIEINQAMISFEDGSKQAVFDLPKTFFSDKALTVVYQVPINLDTKHNSLAIATYYSSLDCYLDCQDVYHYTSPASGLIKSGGRVQHLISLADKSSCREVKLVYTSQLISRDKIVVEPLTIGEPLDMFIDSLIHEDLFLVIAIFLLFGLFIIMILAKLFFFRKIEYGDTLFAIAAFYLLYAIFLISQNNSTQYLLSLFNFTLYAFQYIVMLAAQLPLLLIFKRGLASKYRNRFNYLIIYIMLVLSVQIILVYFFDLQFEDVKLVSLFSIVISTLWIIYTYFNTAATTNPNKTYLMVSFLPITIGTLIILFLKINSEHNYFSIAINLQLLLFIIGQFYYATHIYSNLVNEELKNAEYKRLSLLDFMTGLKNRTAYIKYLEDRTVLRKSQWIVFIDLNNLKLLNDTYGHDYGDVVINRIATVIKTLSETKYNIEAFRIGGDEFILFIEATLLDSIEDLLDRLIIISKEQRDLKTGDLNFSVGYAYYDATKDNLLDVINTADMRMYSEKFGDISE